MMDRVLQRRARCGSQVGGQFPRGKVCVCVCYRYLANGLPRVSVQSTHRESPDPFGMRTHELRAHLELRMVAKRSHGQP